MFRNDTNKIIQSKIHRSAPDVVHPSISSSNKLQSHCTGIAATDARGGSSIKCSSKQRRSGSSSDSDGLEAEVSRDRGDNRRGSDANQEDQTNTRSDNARRGRRSKPVCTNSSRDTSTISGTDKRRSRGWCFTLNNYTADEYAHIVQVIDNQCTFGVVGREVGESGTPHLQGYFYMANTCSFSAVVKMLDSSRVHIERAKGTPQQNKVYCTKSDHHAYVHGTIPSQGKRTDLDELVDNIKNGTVSNLRDVAEVHGVEFIKYSSGIERFIHRLKDKPRDPVTCPFVVWLFGATGCGKSRLSYEIAHEYFINNFYYKPDGPWWDGYCGEKLVLFDDFRSDSMRFSELLRSIDRYPLMVPYKGGFCHLNSVFFIFSSPFSIDDAYAGKNEDIAQLKRRVTHEEEITLENYDEKKKKIFDIFQTKTNV